MSWRYQGREGGYRGESWRWLSVDYITTSKGIYTGSVKGKKKEREGEGGRGEMDRVVLIASRSQVGSVGCVWINARTPSLLPWTTKESNNAAFALTAGPSPRHGIQRCVFPSRGFPHDRGGFAVRSIGKRTTKLLHQLIKAPGGLHTAPRGGR